MSWKNLKVIFKPIKYVPFIGDFTIGYVNEGNRMYECGVKIQEPYNCSVTNYAIYIIADEELKSDDIYYSYITGDVCRALCDGGEPLTDKKVVATTDSSLKVLVDYEDMSNMPIYKNLPTPSIEWVKHFIKELNNGVKLKTIDVKYDDNTNIISVDSNNRIDIKFDSNNSTSMPIDAMKNIIGYIDTPIGRRKYPQEVIDSVVELKKWIENNT